MQAWVVILSATGILMLTSSLCFSQSTDAFVSIIYEMPSGDICESGCTTVYGPTQIQSINIQSNGYYAVEYRLRECTQTTPKYYDILLERVVVLGNNGYDPFLGHSYAEIIELVAKQLLLNNVFGILSHEYECSGSHVRVFRPSCWIRLNLDSQDCPVIYEPCSAPVPTTCAVDIYCLEFTGTDVTDAIRGAGYNNESCTVEPCENLKAEYENNCESAYGYCNSGGGQ